MSTEPNTEREAMVKRAGVFIQEAGMMSSGTLDLMADFALAETAALRTQLATAREALKNIHASGGRLTSQIAHEALAKMEQQK